MSGSRRLKSRQERAAVAARFSEHQGGAVQRAQLRSHGVGRDDVRAEVSAGRWQVTGRHTVLVGTDALSADVAPMPSTVAAGLPRVRPALSG